MHKNAINCKKVFRVLSSMALLTLLVLVCECVFCFHPPKIALRSRNNSLLS